MPVFFLLLLSSYYSNNFAGVINASLYIELLKLVRQVLGKIINFVIIP